MRAQQSDAMRKGARFLARELLREPVKQAVREALREEAAGVRAAEGSDRAEMERPTPGPGTGPTTDQSTGARSALPKLVIAVVGLVTVFAVRAAVRRRRSSERSSAAEFQGDSGTGGYDARESGDYGSGEDVETVGSGS